MLARTGQHACAGRNDGAGRGRNHVKVGEAAGLMSADATSVSAELFDKQISDYSIDSRSVGGGETCFLLSRKRTTPAPVLTASLSMLIALLVMRSSVVQLPQ